MIVFTLFLHTNFYIYMYKDTLARTLQQTKEQLEACREAKHRLEMDWSDKYSAQHLGTYPSLKHFFSWVNINSVAMITGFNREDSRKE